MISKGTSGLLSWPRAQIGTTAALQAIYNLPRWFKRAVRSDASKTVSTRDPGLNTSGRMVDSRERNVP